MTSMRELLDNTIEFLTMLSYYMESFTTLFWVKIVFTAIVGLIWHLIGDVTAGLMAASIIYVIDFSLGIFLSLYKDTFSWARFTAGMVKLGMYFVLIILAHQFDITMQDLINVDHNINIFFAKYWVIGYIATHEFLSALVKMEMLGLPVPQGLVNKVRKNKKVFDGLE